MKRQLTNAAKLALAVAALLAVSGVVAAGSLPPSKAPRRVAVNSLNLYVAPAPNMPVIVPSYGSGSAQGTAIPPDKAVVLNPYNVPLFQDAGVLGSGR
jgi:hypothetical protein